MEASVKHCRSCGELMPDNAPANHFSCRRCYATAARKLTAGNAVPVSRAQLDGLIDLFKDGLKQLENLKNTST